MDTEHSANKLRGKSPQRLEGSRFGIRQLGNVAASGSRERLAIVQLCPSGAYLSLPEQRLEGSRFAIRQLCEVAASGSRERLVIVQLYPFDAYPSLPEQRRLVKASRCDVTGSRLLPSDRTNALKSGSPPGAGRCDVMFHTSTRTN